MTTPVGTVPPLASAGGGALVGPSLDVTPLTPEQAAQVDAEIRAENEARLAERPKRRPGSRGVTGADGTWYPSYEDMRADPAQARPWDGRGLGARLRSVQPARAAWDGKGLGARLRNRPPTAREHARGDAGSR